jgi:hypothetical protein
VETANFNHDGLAYGVGFTVAYGRGGSIGMKGAYFFGMDGNPAVLEVTVLLRMYLLDWKGNGAIKGPWLQFNGGPALYYMGSIAEGNDSMGNMSAGISFGWRFLLGNYFFAEPYVKGGYPYLFGGGIAIGYHYGGKNK